MKTPGLLMTAATLLNDFTFGILRHQHKYYVSSIVEYGDQCVTLKAARKYGEHQGKITFCWPTIDDIFTVKGGLNAENSLGLPDPVVDRRGSSLRFRKRAFGEVPLTYVI